MREKVGNKLFFPNLTFLLYIWEIICIFEKKIKILWPNTRQKNV